MGEETCRECKFHTIGYRGQIWCTLAHNFVMDLDGFCPREKSVEEIRNSCDWHLSPEEMDDGKSCCLAHLSEGRALICRIRRIEDLLKDPDFKVRRP